MDNKNEQKRDRKGLVILVLLLVAIVSTTFAVTFSRYISAAEATTQATVAKWDVKLGKKDGTLSDITSGNIALEDCTWTNTVSTAQEGTMAPGSVCNYLIHVENDSQVDAKVSFDITGILDADGESVNTSYINIDMNSGTVDNPVEIARGQSADVPLTITWAAGNSESPSDVQNRADTAMGLDPTTMTIYMDVVASQKIVNS